MTCLVVLLIAFSKLASRTTVSASVTDLIIRCSTKGFSPLFPVGFAAVVPILKTDPTMLDVNAVEFAFTTAWPALLRASVPVDAAVSVPLYVTGRGNRR